MRCRLLHTTLFLFSIDTLLASTTSSPNGVDSEADTITGGTDHKSQNDQCQGTASGSSQTTANINNINAKCKTQEYLKYAGHKWNWEPTSTSHPCNIRRISRSELLRVYGTLGVPNLYPYPLVIYPDNYDSANNRSSYDGPNYPFSELTTLQNLPLNFSPEFNVTLTGSDSLSSHRRTIPLSQYLSEILTANENIGKAGETLPDQLGNETWYLFGETFTSDWENFLKNYILPPCHSCTPIHHEQNLVALSFGIGNIGSGVQWHLHGPGFSETIHGRKHWVLYPPHLRPVYNMEYASRHWMEHVYPTLKDWGRDELDLEKKSHHEFLQQWRKLKKGRKRPKYPMVKVLDDSGSDSDDEDDNENGPSTKKPYECTIHAGEMIYFPDGWHHATINLEKYTVFVSSFTSEHDD